MPIGYWGTTCELIGSEVALYLIVLEQLYPAESIRFDRVLL